jgi:hypothetical protein
MEGSLLAAVCLFSQKHAMREYFKRLSELNCWDNGHCVNKSRSSNMFHRLQSHVQLTHWNFLADLIIKLFQFVFTPSWIGKICLSFQFQRSIAQILVSLAAVEVNRNRTQKHEENGARIGVQFY